MFDEGGLHSVVAVRDYDEARSRAK